MNYRTYTKKDIANAEAMVIAMKPRMTNIIQDLIYTLDLSVDDNNLVYYNEQLFFFNKQYIVYTEDVTNPPKTVFPFIPYYNPKFAQTLFKHFLILYAKDTGADILAYFTIPGTDSNGYMTHRANVRFRNPDGTARDLSSDEYENETIAYLDLIYRLDNRPEDLHDIDRIVTYLNYKFYMERNSK